MTPLGEPRRRCGVVSTLVLTVVLAGAIEAGPAPDWLYRASQKEAPDYAPDVPAVVLVREQTITVEPDGWTHTSERGAIRILNSEGRDEAECAVFYTTDTEKVRSLGAWLIEGGETWSYGKKHIIDRQLSPEDVYNEVRVSTISARERAAAGTVFGYAWEVEGPMLFAQVGWLFQGLRPVLVSRLRLVLPSGWQPHAVTFNHPPVAVQQVDRSWQWELRDLEPIRTEPLGPTWRALIPRLAISLDPGPAKDKLDVPVFRTWKDVSQWMTELSAPQSEVDETIESKALELTATATSDLERIRAVASYVQSLNYVAIQTGVGRGGGYRPHAAKDVLRNNYGDCKDKANLMCTLLKAIDIPAYLVNIYSGDRSFAREAWPSPQQFNHCIVAVDAPEGIDLATRFEVPELGTVFAFDPTDPYTPLGGLPESEQGSLALVVAGARGNLLRMPKMPPDSNWIVRRIEAELRDDGSIQAQFLERSAGTWASEQRARYRAVSKRVYRKRVEQMIARDINGASVTGINLVDDPTSGQFQLELAFSAPKLGQRIGGSLLAFRPALVGRREPTRLQPDERVHPVLLNPRHTSAVTAIALPPGFEIEELPDSVDLTLDACRYRARYVVRGDQLLCEQTLRTSDMTISPDRYDDVRRFFERVRKAEMSMAVLRRKER